MIDRRKRTRKREPWVAPPPEDLILAAQRLVDGLRMGRHQALRTGDAEEFYDYRPYAPGDPMSRVDWRAAARRDDLHLRRRRHEAPMTVAIALDASESMAFRSIDERPWPSKLRAGQEIAAALAMIALRQGDRVALATGASEGEASPVISGRDGFGAMATTLAAVIPAGRMRLSALLDFTSTHIPAADLIVVISDALEEPSALAAALERAAHRARTAREIMLIQVLSEDELAPSARGVTLMDPESDARCAVRDDTDAERSAAAIAAHVEQVRRLTHMTRGRYALHRTSQPAVETLRSLLAPPA